MKVFPCVSKSMICLARTWFLSSMPVDGCSVMECSMRSVMVAWRLRVYKTEHFDGFLTLCEYYMVI